MKHKKFILVLSFAGLFLLSAFSCYFLTNYIIHKNSKVSADQTPISRTVPPTDNSNSNNTPMNPPKQDTTTEVLISSVGDCTIGSDDKFTFNTLPSVLHKNNNDYSYFFKNVVSIFKADDLTTANLETTFTNSTVKLKKGPEPFYNFKAPPEYAKALTLGSIEAVNISNNHIHDYLDKGLNDTKSALQQNNINYFGEGTKYITTIKGQKFGFLGYTGFSNDSSFLNRMKNDIKDLKSQNCIVIINIHWGVEGSYKPNAVQTSIAHYAIDNGADLIVGHHPHVVESIEQYKGKIICYSMGNFCFGGNANPPDKDTFILQTKYIFKNDKFTSFGIKVIPCSISSVSNINDYCPTPLTGNRKTQVLNKLINLSPNLNLKLSDDFTYLDVNN